MLKKLLNSIKNNIKKNWWKYLILLIYIIFIFIIILKHEPWADEAQAWLIARDASYPDILMKYIRIEGSPGLWHLILSIPAKLGLPYLSMNIISGLIAFAGVYVFLFYSPFPKYIKVLLPFSYFTFYQYGVVARNYVLLPLLLFLIAMLYKDKKEKIFIFIILLGLLANVSLHGFIIANSIIFIHFIDLVKERKSLTKEDKIKQIKAFAIFAAVFIAVFIMVWPPKDLLMRGGFQLDFFNFLKNSFYIFNETISFFLFIPALIWFHKRKTLLLYLVPTFGLLAFFSIKYYMPWHQGALVIIFIFVTWICLEKEGIKLSKIAKVNLVLLFILLLFQITWTFDSSLRDYYGHYSVGKDIADYIKENGLQDKKIYAVNYWSIVVLPYFADNIFDNYHNGQKPCFWLWLKDPFFVSDFDPLIKDQPDLLILPAYANKNITGYKFEGIFFSNTYWKRTKNSVEHNFVLFRKEE